MAIAKKDYSSLRVIAGPDGILVQDANRKAIPGIFGVDISIRPGKPPVMRVNLICGHFDVAGTPLFAVADPASGQPRLVSRIEFADGGTFEPPPPPAVVADPGAAGKAMAEATNPDAQVVQPSGPQDNAPKPNGGGV